ncbi:hypothetical protein [Paenibacillus periandrae]|uniref:hypothetical protein n=1 Tax=Paenibacillus periandrae TaxID=1761741 RepID=UPI001F08FB67|nr:hypothetical protein [Paenibacillus periandrae]
MEVEYKIFIKGTEKAYIDGHMVIPNKESVEIEFLSEEEKSLEIYYHVYSHAGIDKIKDYDRTEINYI